MSRKKAANGVMTLSETALELIATRFRALGEPTRLKLLNILMKDEHTVGQLVEASGSGQANVSKHLSLLREAGMIDMRKDGLSTICSLADPMVKSLCEQMCTRLREELDAKSRALMA